MPDFDLVVRGGLVVSAADMVRADIGIRGGRIAALADPLDSAAHTIDAGELWVMPGGVDPHCHIEQLEPGESVHEETFVTASISAFAGGTTSVITFASQFLPLSPNIAAERNNR
jgi:dihydropyrimidinase